MIVHKGSQYRSETKSPTRRTAMNCRERSGKASTVTKSVTAFSPFPPSPPAPRRIAPLLPKSWPAMTFLKESKRSTRLWHRRDSKSCRGRRSRCLLSQAASRTRRSSRSVPYAPTAHSLSRHPSKSRGHPESTAVPEESRRYPVESRADPIHGNSPTRGVLRHSMPSPETHFAVPTCIHSAI